VIYKKRVRKLSNSSPHSPLNSKKSPPKLRKKLAMLLGWSIKKSHKKFEVPHKVHKVRPERRSTLVS